MGIARPHYAHERRIGDIMHAVYKETCAIGLDGWIVETCVWGGSIDFLFYKPKKNGNSPFM